MPLDGEEFIPDKYIDAKNDVLKNLPPDLKREQELTGGPQIENPAYFSEILAKPRDFGKLPEAKTVADYNTLMERLRKELRATPLVSEPTADDFVAWGQQEGEVALDIYPEQKVILSPKSSYENDVLTLKSAEVNIHNHPSKFKISPSHADYLMESVRHEFTRRPFQLKEIPMYIVLKDFVSQSFVADEKVESGGRIFKFDSKPVEYIKWTDKDGKGYDLNEIEQMRALGEIQEEDLKAQFILVYKKLNSGKEEELVINLPPNSILDWRWCGKNAEQLKNQYSDFLGEHETITSYNKLIQIEIYKALTHAHIQEPITIKNFPSGNFQRITLVPHNYFAKMYARHGFWEIFSPEAKWEKLMADIQE